jgi:plastocyanin
MTPPRLLVQPGQPVKILFENGDDLPHNLVFCQPGTDTAAMAMKQMEKPDEALKRNWLPDDPRIWLHSKMLNPHEKEELTFTAPEKPGTYPYVCTFPGHALTMRGEMKVAPMGEGLQRPPIRPLPRQLVPAARFLEAQTAPRRQGR